MEIKRKCELEILSKQPLALVLMQIRFSPVPLIENYINNIQAALNKLGFPLFEQNDNLSVEVSPKGNFYRKIIIFLCLSKMIIFL